jgi:hypothetical protein
MTKSIALLASGVAVLTLLLSGCGGTVSGSDSSSDTDPIHQATTVLSDEYGDSVSYAQVKAVTDSALSEAGDPVNDEYRAKAWSAVLAVLKQPELAKVDPMDIMTCVSGGSGGAGMTLPQMVAVCAVSSK